MAAPLCKGAVGVARRLESTTGNRHQRVCRQSVSCAQVFRIGTNATHNAKDGLDEQGWLDQALLKKMGERVKMPYIVALELKPCSATLAQLKEDRFDILERVLKDVIPCVFKMFWFPVIFPRLIAGK